MTRINYKEVDIVKIAEQFGMKPVRRVGKSIDYVCPFCSDETGHLNLLPAPKNYWRCNKCDKGGGVLTLIMLKLNCSKEDARAFLIKKSGFTYSILENNGEKNFENWDEDTKIAPPEVLDHTYRTLISILKTSPEHMQNLKNRGLTPKEIKGCGFKTLPKESDVYIPYQLLKEGCILEGVPGFYMKYGKWRINNFNSGFLVPFINYKGQLTGLQIRSDKDTKAKYKSFSSTGLYKGTKSAIECHVSGRLVRNGSVLLTEGALKAAVIKIFRKKLGKNVCVLAIPGVNNAKGLYNLIPLLKKLNITVYEAFDADKKGNTNVSLNPRVKEAVDKITSKLTSEGIECHPVFWSKEKGYDDYLKKIYDEGVNNE